MKTKILFLTMLLFHLVNQSCILNAQTFDVNGSYQKSEHVLDNKGINTFDYYFDNMMSWDSIRPLNEINKQDSANAYPYISPDGLRIYFTQGIGGATNNNIYFASRDDINSHFQNTQRLSTKIPEGSFSCWLTNDELEIYYVYNLNLYFTSRTSMSLPFADPIQINLIENIQGWISCPSLTPDKQELYIYNQDIDKCILKFIQSDSYTYTLVDTLAVPSNSIANPGQLSKNGLKYYFSLKDNSDSTKLFQMERSDITSQFENLLILNNDINSELFNVQPSVSFDENILVFVRNNEDSWIGNNLFIAFNLNTGVQLHQENIIDIISISPNPCNDKIKVNFKLSENTLISFSVYDIYGKMVFIEDDYFSNGTHNKTLSLNKAIPEGMYLLNIKVGNYLETFKFIKSY